MSLQSILKPNSYHVHAEKFHGDIEGNIISTDIIYHTLTQDNNNSFIDASGNTKLGNCQAGDINAVNLNASTGITSGTLGVNTTGPVNCVNLTATGVTTLGDVLDNGLRFQPLTGTLSLYNETGQSEVLIEPSNGVNTDGGKIQLTKEGSDIRAIIKPNYLLIGDDLELAFPGLIYNNGSLSLLKPMGAEYTNAQINCSYINPLLIQLQGSKCIYETTSISNYYILNNTLDNFIVLQPGVTSITLPSGGFFANYCYIMGLATNSFGIYFNLYIVNNTGGTVTINNSADGQVISNTATVPNSTNVINYKFVIIDYTFAATPSVIMY
jgi:hypothetical protein